MRRRHAFVQGLIDLGDQRGLQSDGERVLAKFPVQHPILTPGLILGFNLGPRRQVRTNARPFIDDDIALGARRAVQGAAVVDLTSGRPWVVRAFLLDIDRARPAGAWMVNIDAVGSHRAHPVAARWPTRRAAVYRPLDHIRQSGATAR